jgi:hypothetical protein
MFTFTVDKPVNGQDACAPLVETESGTDAQHTGCIRIKTTQQIMGANGCVTDTTVTPNPTYSEWICDCPPRIYNQQGTGEYADCYQIVTVQQVVGPNGTCIDDPNPYATGSASDWICPGTPGASCNIVSNEKSNGRSTIGVKCGNDPVNNIVIDDGQDFDACNGSTSGDVLKSSSTSYSIGSKVSGKNYYAAPGKVIESRIMCNNNAGTPFETPDTCFEVARGSSGCTSPNVYKQCKPANGGAAYYVCESGTSILDTALAAETAAGNANPCAGSNANSNTIVKNITKASYDRGTKTNNIYSKVGTSQVQKTTCDGSTTTETTQDPCIEIDKPSSSVCTGNTKAYLKCTSAESTDTTYYVCQDLGSNTSLSGKIDGKVDASTMNSAISAATSAATLGESLKDTFVKPSALNGYVTTSGSGNNSIGKVLESNNVITTSNIENNIPGTVAMKTDLPDTSNFVTTSGSGNNSIGKILESNNVITTRNIENNMPSNVVTTSNLSTEVGKLGYATTSDIPDQATIANYVETAINNSTCTPSTARNPASCSGLMAKIVEKLQAGGYVESSENANN